VLVKHPECDVRSWLMRSGQSVKIYTLNKIEESYALIDNILSQCNGVKQNNAYDVGCGS